MKHYVVLDTNVIVSAMLKGDSIPGIVVMLALDGQLIPLVSDIILEEYREVLSRSKFGLNKSAVLTLISELEKRALFPERMEIDEIFPDPDDAVFYEVTMSARTTVPAFLVTVNKKHFPTKTFVVTPREMLDILEREEGELSIKDNKK